jgi:carboxypeptidase T
MMVFKYIFPLTIFFLIIAVNVSAGEKLNPLFTKKWSFLGSIESENMHKTFEKLNLMDIDIAGVDSDNKIIDVLMTDYDYENLVKKGFDVKISEAKGISRGPDPEYKNPAEIERIVMEFADRYPHLTKRVSIGKSLEGRDIWALKISDNPETDENLEPKILFNSMHHAREVMTPEVSLDIIETLLSGYGSELKITNWVNSYEIWVIPMFNVDGNNKMWSVDSWWRKNTRGGYGVDLNRNYPTGWNKCNGSSGRKSSQTYRGPSPASEPETQAMMNFIANVRPVFDISYHAYSELVIYPFGCKGERTATEDVVEGIGKQIAKKLNYKPGTAWELLYNADGGDIDWMYDAYQVIPYVIELNSRREGFHPKYSKWRDKTVIKNRAGWQFLLDRLGESGVRGQFTQNNIAVSDYTIKVFKTVNATRFLYQTYVGHKNGMYHLVLTPGEYYLEFIINNNTVKKVKKSILSKLDVLDVKL